jgi:hypothetical protein
VRFNARLTVERERRVASAGSFSVIGRRSAIHTSPADFPSPP